MSVLSRAVSVTTTATRLDSTSDSKLAASVAFYNIGAQTVYVGGSGVTTASGVPVAASSWSPGFDVREDEGLYAIVAATTCEVRVIEAGL